MYNRNNRADDTVVKLCAASTLNTDACCHAIDHSPVVSTVVKTRVIMDIAILAGELVCPFTY